MISSSFKKILAGLPLGDIWYFDQIGSTNDAALECAGEGAPDLSLVYAEEQTSGKGRGDRIWYTHPGTGLAFSLVLNVTPTEAEKISLFSMLGALSVCEGIMTLGINAEIKWPNDILINRKKVSGMLVEAVWMGEHIESLVLGIGLNVTRNAEPPLENLLFPSTSLETELEFRNNPSSEALDKYVLLRQILEQIISWRKSLDTDLFFRAWEKRIAFMGKGIELWGNEKLIMTGKLVGVDRSGALHLQEPNGKTNVVNFGEIHLRPVL
jgi:BirA family transcriptional regulator, biotin operon repressor / biotin---[acetyl-CoA-carboxylase] ligase